MRLTEATTGIRYVVIGAAVSCAIYATLFVGADLADEIHGEDSLIEYIGAVALLAGSVAFLLCFLRTRSDERYSWIKRAAFLLLAISFFFGAGEEISWGQRLFGVETPDALSEANEQDELNFHNLDFLGIFSFENIFQLFWLGFGVLVPVACALSERLRGRLDPLMPILPVWLAVLFVVQQAIGEGIEVYLEANPDQYHAESAGSLATLRFEATETILALLLAVGALFVYRRVNLETRGTAPAGP